MRRMSEIGIPVNFPVDDDGYFRRRCPLCKKEFKLLLKKEELEDIEQKGIESYILKREKEERSDVESEDAKFVCPYCGQKSVWSNWWTQEQEAYIGVIAENIMAQLLNEHFIRPLKRNLRKSKSSFIQISLEGEELKKKEPWMSPEMNDMDLVSLNCCDRMIKIEDDYVELVYCYYCGFPHKKQ
jgi:predicted RNA-binding Zn-ribbon protein involved in translation (DUF1610 family)